MQLQLYVLVVENAHAICLSLQFLLQLLRLCFVSCCCLCELLQLPLERLVMKGPIDCCCTLPALLMDLLLQLMIALLCCYQLLLQLLLLLSGEQMLLSLTRICCMQKQPSLCLLGLLLLLLKLLLQQVPFLLRSLQLQREVSNSNKMFFCLSGLLPELLQGVSQFNAPLLQLLLQEPYLAVCCKLLQLQLLCLLYELLHFNSSRVSFAVLQQLLLLLLQLFL